MKALTIRQPWAWAVAAGHKTVENRSRNTAHRGSIAIHAGSAWSHRGSSDERVLGAFRSFLYPSETERIEPAYHRLELSRGAVVAVASLVGAHPDDGDCCRPWGESTYLEHGGRQVRDIWHWQLADVVRLAWPVPCPGRLGVWTLPPDVERDVLAQVTR